MQREGDRGTRRSARRAWVYGALLFSLPAPALGQSWVARAMSGPRAIELLGSEAPAERARAATLLARVGASDTAISALTRALTSEGDPAVHAALLRALIVRGDPRAARDLVIFSRARAQRRPSLVASALAATGAPEAIEALVQALASPSEMSRAAGRALVTLGTRAVPYLLRALTENPSAPLVATLGAIGDSQAVAAIGRLVLHSDPTLRAAALVSLRAIRDSRSAKIVAQAVGDASVDVSIEAIRTLGVVGQAEHAELLRGIADSGVDMARAREALRSLAQLNATSALPLLEQQAEDPKLARGATAIALEIRDPAVVPTLVRIMQDGHREAAAADALARIEDGAGVRALLIHAGNSPAARRSLAIAVRRWKDILDAVTIAASYRVLRESNDSAHRRLVLRALAGDAKAVAPALALLEADEPAARATAALALQFLQDSAAVPSLMAALRSEDDPEVFRRTARALLSLSAAPDAAELWRATSDPEIGPEAFLLAASITERMTPQERKRWARHGIQALREAEDRTRAAAARLLGALQRFDARLSGVLVDGLRDPNPDVRRACARALAQRRARNEDAEIRAALWLEQEADVQAALGDALGRPRPARLAENGLETLQVFIKEGDAAVQHEGIDVDVVLADGQWLLCRTLATGELFLVDLPEGTADVRVRVDRRHP